MLEKAKVVAFVTFSVLDQEAEAEMRSDSLVDRLRPRDLITSERLTMTCDLSVV